MSDAWSLIGQTLEGKYRIEKVLGQGGMGSVFLATHLGTDRRVAVKVILDKYAGHEEFVARFQREARAVGRLRHPNIVDMWIGDIKAPFAQPQLSDSDHSTPLEGSRCARKA